MHHESFKTEVERRKARFAEIKSEIDALLMTENDSGHVKRENLERATTLKEEAAALVDSGLDWLKTHAIEWRTPPGSDAPSAVCNCDKDRESSAGSSRCTMTTTARTS